MPGAEVSEELRKGLFARTEKDRVRVRLGLGRKGCHVQSPERDEAAAGSVEIGQPVRAVGVRDVDLDDDEIRAVVQGQRPDMFVLDDCVVIGAEVCREGREAEGRKEGVFNRPPEGAGGLGEGGEDEFDPQRPRHNFAL